MYNYMQSGVAEDVQGIPGNVLDISQMLQHQYSHLTRGYFVGCHPVQLQVPSNSLTAKVVDKIIDEHRVRGEAIVVGRIARLPCLYGRMSVKGALRVQIHEVLGIAYDQQRHVQRMAS